MTRKEVSDRFASFTEQERVKRGFTQSQMAEKLGLSLSGYKKMVTGAVTKIDLYTAVKMYNLAGLLIGDMIGFNGKLFEVSSKLSRLSSNQLAYIESVVDLELAMAADQKGEELLVYVPTGNVEDGMIYDSAHVTSVPAGEYYKRFGDRLHCGIKITSGHMAPVYYEGDILLICQMPIRDGDTGIFYDRQTGRIYVRKFVKGRPCKLEPVNGFGRTIIVNQDDPDQLNRWIKFGYVLSKMR